MRLQNSSLSLSPSSSLCFHLALTPYQQDSPYLLMICVWTCTKVQPEINCFSSLQLICIPSFTLGLSQGYHDSRRQSKVLGLLTAKSIAKLLGPRFWQLGLIWQVSTNTGCPSQRHSEAVAAGNNSLAWRKSAATLAILTVTDLVWESNRSGSDKSLTSQWLQVFFDVKWNFQCSYCYS